ncbi:MAG: LytTR family DNA-binding domain-containing protein [Bacteroidota bacterium]
MPIIKCAVADNDPVVGEKIREFIAIVGYLYFSGYAPNPEIALELMSTNSIDVLFVSDEFPGLSALAVIRNAAGRPPAIVLLQTSTSKSNNTLKPLDTLMKPIQLSQFENSAEKALKQFNIMTNAASGKKDFFLIKINGRLQKINLSELVYISGMQNYVKVHLQNGRSHTVHSTLKNFYRQLDSQRFIMVHKSYIVNTDFIDSVSANQIKLSGMGEVPVGRIYKSNIHSLLFNRS